MPVNFRITWEATVGRVYVDSIDANRELVAQGFAWVYRKYSNDAELLRLEAEAKKKGLGLWAEPVI